jgi:hypothetical protein
MSNFKIGDWVREPDGDIWKLDNEVEKGSYVDTDCELWQPRAGEWCWLVPIFKTTEVHKLVKYNKEEFDKDMKFEPFIGELPSFIKDNK